MKFYSIFIKGLKSHFNILLPAFLLVVCNAMACFIANNYRPGNILFAGGGIVFVVLSIIVIVYTIILISKSKKHDEQVIGKNEQINEYTADFELVSQNTETGIIVYNNSEIVFINKIASVILGIDKNSKQIVIDNFIAADQMARFKKFLKQLNKQKNSINDIDIWITDNRGNKRYVQLKIIFKKHVNSITKTFVIIKDITESFLFNQHLLWQSEILTQVPICIVVTDLNGNIEFVNPVFEKLTGYKIENVIGKKISILKSGKMSDNFYKHLWQTISEGRNWRSVFQNKKQNGELYWDSVIIFPIKNNKNEIINYASLHVDVTENIMIKEELIKANEKAVQSDKLKSAFLANVSHEVNTPINVVKGFTQLLKAKLADRSDLVDYLKYIDQNTQILMDLFNDIIDFSKMESGTIEANKTDCNVNEIIDKVYREFLQKISDDERQIVLHTVYPEKNSEPVMVYSDKQLIIKIFDKLMSNALKYTPVGDIFIGYNIVDNMVDFFVKDAGVGIPENQKDKIFELFYHGGNEYVSLHKGLGLGLNIVKETVESLGGFLRFTSTEQKGSTFYFSIPLKLDNNIVNSTTNTKTISEFLKTKVFLIVDIEETSYKQIKLALGIAGAATIWAKSSAEAIDLCEYNKGINAVFIDIVMPELDGSNIARILKIINPQVPLFALSSINYEQLPTNNGLFEGFVKKPVAIDSLINTLAGFYKA